MYQVEKAEQMPPVVRSKKKKISEETLRFQEALKSGGVNVIRNVSAGIEYTRLQQRIRVAGAKCDPPLKTAVRKEDIGDNLVNVYFEGYIYQEKEN